MLGVAEEVPRGAVLEEGGAVGEVGEAVGEEGEAVGEEGEAVGEEGGAGGEEGGAVGPGVFPVGPGSRGPGLTVEVNPGGAVGRCGVQVKALCLIRFSKTEIINFA